jgi:hypothetical protein
MACNPSSKLIPALVEELREPFKFAQERLAKIKSGEKLTLASHEEFLTDLVRDLSRADNDISANYKHENEVDDLKEQLNDAKSELRIAETKLTSIRAIL